MHLIPTGEHTCNTSGLRNHEFWDRWCRGSRWWWWIHSRALHDTHLSCLFAEHIKFGIIVLKYLNSYGQLHES